MSHVKSEIARCFREMGQLLEIKGETVFRVHAYARPADTVAVGVPTARRAGTNRDRVVNAWPVADLLDRAGRGRRRA
jgi:hypothetical protein